MRTTRSASGISTGSDRVLRDPLGLNRNLGRLTVNKNLGLNENDEYDSLYVYGARSFAIWRDTGELVYDSGNELERVVGSFGAAPPPPLVLDGPGVPAAKSFMCPIPADEELPGSPC